MPFLRKSHRQPDLRTELTESKSPSPSTDSSETIIERPASAHPVYGPYKTMVGPIQTRRLPLADERHTRTLSDLIVAEENGMDSPLEPPSAGFPLHARAQSSYSESASGTRSSSPFPGASTPFVRHCCPWGHVHFFLAADFS